MKPVQIYTTGYCAYCRRAKQLLTDTQQPVTQVALAAGFAVSSVSATACDAVAADT